MAVVSAAAAVVVRAVVPAVVSAAVTVVADVQSPQIARALCAASSSSNLFLFGDIMEVDFINNSIYKKESHGQSPQDYALIKYLLIIWNLIETKERSSRCSIELVKGG